MSTRIISDLFESRDNHSIDEPRVTAIRSEIVLAGSNRLSFSKQIP